MFQLILEFPLGTDQPTTWEVKGLDLSPSIEGLVPDLTPYPPDLSCPPPEGQTLKMKFLEVLP